MNPKPSCLIKTAVVGIGAATLDDLWLLNEFSDQEGVAQAEAHIQMGGGPVATALCVLGRLGHSAQLLDAVGDDEAGNVIRSGLLHAGVSDLGLREVTGVRSALAVILVRKRDGARQIHFLPSSCGELTLDEVHVEMIQQARLLHINGRHEAACRAAVEIALAAGVTISFDGGAGRYRDSLSDLVAASQIRIFSRDFARRYCGTDDLQGMMATLLEKPAAVVVITAGTDGSYVATPQQPMLHQPAYAATPLVDTTGCGDVYHGAFLHGWLQQWPAERCAEFASRLAAKNAEGLGGRWVCEPEVRGVLDAFC